MLEDYYYDVQIWRDSGTDPYNSFDPAEQEFTLLKTIQGFMQTRGGSYSQSNQSNMPSSTHILYTDIGHNLIEGDKAKVEGISYRIDFTQNDVGISGVEDHQEILCTYEKAKDV